MIPQQIEARFEANPWVQLAQTLARQLAKEHGEVTADDIWRYLPQTDGIDRRAMGAVFKGMKKLGYRNSTRKECHHRPIAVWGLK